MRTEKGQPGYVKAKKQKSSGPTWRYIMCGPVLEK